MNNVSDQEFWKRMKRLDDVAAKAGDMLCLSLLRIKKMINSLVNLSNTTKKNGWHNNANDVWYCMTGADLPYIMSIP